VMCDSVIKGELLNRMKGRVTRAALCPFQPEQQK